MSNAVAIIEALLAAEQGVRNVTVGYGQCGNLVQDVAALRVLEELTEEYLDRYGYSDVVVTSVLHRWMVDSHRMKQSIWCYFMGKFCSSTCKKQQKLS